MTGNLNLTVSGPVRKAVSTSGPRTLHRTFLSHVLPSMGCGAGSMASGSFRVWALELDPLDWNPDTAALVGWLGVLFNLCKPQFSHLVRGKVTIVFPLWDCCDD